MKKIKLSMVLLIVLLCWLLSEFGPEEFQGIAGLVGIGMAVIAILKLRKK